jgi:hypothetical protein
MLIYKMVLMGDRLMDDVAYLQPPITYSAYLLYVGMTYDINIKWFLSYRIMGLTDSPAKLAIIFIIAGVVIVFAIFGTSARSIFVSSTTEESAVEIKQADECIVQASDGIPRKISNCPYEQGEAISITYKPGQPNIESHRPAQN